MSDSEAFRAYGKTLERKMMWVKRQPGRPEPSVWTHRPLWRGIYAMRHPFDRSLFSEATKYQARDSTPLSLLSRQQAVLIGSEI